ncbi:MAG: hypothetical protein WCK42_06125 [Myxococcaceae bacterium]
MFRTKIGFIETKAREIHGHSALDIRFNEETDFVHIEHVNSVPKLSPTPLRELTKQVDLFEGKVGFWARKLLKPRLPQEVLTEVQSQLSAYEHVSEKDECIPIHLAQLENLDVRLRQRINFNQFVEDLLNKVSVFTKSLTNNIDPRDIPAKIRKIEEYKLQLSGPCGSRAKTTIQVLNRKKAALEDLATTPKEDTRKFIKLALDPKNIPSGCTASLGRSQSFIQSESPKVDLKPIEPVVALLQPMKDLDLIIGEAEVLLDQMTDISGLIPKEALFGVVVLQMQQIALAGLKSEFVEGLQGKIAAKIRDLNQIAQNITTEEKTLMSGL